MPGTGTRSASALPTVMMRPPAAGATVIAEPTRTPWASLNARLEAPADLQLTLFTDDPA
jgi:hypothetical protein